MQFASGSRRTLLLSIILVAVLCGSVLGYLLSLPPPEGLKVTITSPPIQFSMSLDKTRYSLTDNMSQTFCLRNISNETVTWRKGDMMDIGDSYGVKLTTVAEGVTVPFFGTDPTGGEYMLRTLFHFGYVLAFGNGTIIDEEYVGPLKSAYDIVLDPNGSLNQTLCISLTYPDVVNPNRYEHFLEKGTYQISGVIYPIINSSEPYLRDPHGLRYLKTPPITFSIW
jgi:hypothetical protein